MAGILQINQAAARKRALCAQCDIYRETVRLELRNLHLYGVSTRRRIARLNQFLPIFTAMAMLARSYVKKRSKPSLLGRALWAWQLFQTVAPSFGLLGGGRRTVASLKPSSRNLGL